MRYMIAAALAAVSAVPAEAAVVTQSYSVQADKFSNFYSDAPPFKSLTIDFTVTYDNLGNGFLGAPASFVASADGVSNPASFAGPLTFGYFQPNAMTTLPRLGIGGTLNGPNVMLNGTNDFYLVFSLAPTGPIDAMLSFTATGYRTPFTAIAATVRSAPVGSVPEPATWAMMVVGFGIAGAAMRRAHGQRAATA